MTTKTGQQPAFPNDWGREWKEGIDTRLLIAAMAMQGLCANPNLATSDFLPTRALQLVDALLQKYEEGKE